MHTEKVQQLLCPQDFSLQFYFFSESDSAKVLFCIKGHHNFFHKIAFFRKGYQFCKHVLGQWKSAEIHKQYSLETLVSYGERSLSDFLRKKTIPKFKVSRRVHLMCQIYSSLLVKNCWTHQSVQKHFLLIRCWIPQLKSRNSHKGQWGSKSVVFESVHWFLDSTLYVIGISFCYRLGWFFWKNTMIHNISSWFHRFKNK